MGTLAPSTVPPGRILPQREPGVKTPGYFRVVPPGLSLGLPGAGFLGSVEGMDAVSCKRIETLTKAMEQKRVDPKLIPVAANFISHCYDILGAYLDAIAGVEKLRGELVAHQNGIIERCKVSEEFMDQQSAEHQFGADNNDPGKFLHRRTQGEFKQHTSPTGFDGRLLGYMAITLLYSSWEEEFRQKLALALGHPKKDDLKHDLFGDLGKLRNAILHNNGIATAKVGNAKILRWFREGEQIFISNTNVDDLFTHIDSFLEELCGIKESQTPE